MSVIECVFVCEECVCVCTNVYVSVDVCVLVCVEGKVAVTL